MKCHIENGVLLRCEVRPHESVVTVPDKVTVIGEEAFAAIRSYSGKYTRVIS